MKINHILTGIALCGALCACSKLLDVPQNGSFGSQEEFYKTDANVLSGVATIYNQWRSSYEQRMVLLTTLSDEVSKGGANIAFFPDWAQRNSFTYNAGDEVIGNYYKSLYTMVYYCNLITQNVTPDTDVKKQCVAEAKFFWANAYFDLVSLWGETVPFVDHLLSTEEYHVGRSEPGQNWTKMEEYLKDAIAVLPNKSSKTDKSQYRVTSDAAKVMLGKVYLWQKKYADAAKVLDEVIDDERYGLWGVDEPGEYDMLMHAVANDCCEKVLDIRIPNDESNYEKNNLSGATMFLGYFYWSGRQVSFSPAVSSTFSTGDGYFPPRKTLYDRFVAEEGADGYRLKSTMRTAVQLAEAGVNVSQGNLPENYGYFNWKNRGLKADLIAEKSGMGASHMVYTNNPVIRYAEVLLLAAEAHVMAGDDQTKADTYVNKVRQRAHLGDKTGVTLDDIKLEKNLELCFEGVRYMDIIRWGDAMDLMKDQGKEVVQLEVKKDPATGAMSYNVTQLQSNPDAGFKDRNWLLPIPKSEMDVNGVEHGGNMTQNPGW